jgi:ribosome-associated protein
LTQELGRIQRIQRLVDAALEKKGEDIVVLDVKEVTSFADTFILITGSSDRNVRSIVDAVEQAARSMGERPLGIEGYNDGRWVLVDLADVIVHVFVPEAREHYALERLYADAPQLELAPLPAHGSAR